MLIAKGPGQSKLSSSHNHQHHRHHCCMTTIVTKGGHKKSFPTTIIFLWLLFGLDSVYNIVIEKIKKSKRRRGKNKKKKIGKSVELHAMIT
jgi:hypothetical protein